MSRRFLLLFVMTAAAMVTPAKGEKINMSPDALRKTATHVMVGTVVGVYERTETVGDWKFTRCVAQVRVSNWEKGDSVDHGKLTYVRYWHRRWIGKGRVPPSTSGHRGLPSEGETLRVYLARNAYDGFTRDNKDGGFNVIGANGFEKLKKEPTK